MSHLSDLAKITSTITDDESSALMKANNANGARFDLVDITRLVIYRRAVLAGMYWVEGQD